MEKSDKEEEFGGEGDKYKPTHVVFVRGLPSDSTENSLRKYFS
jgi:RNA recognition motif-containing protein